MARASRKLGRVCAECQKAITDRNVSSRCSPCNGRGVWSDPALRERHMAAVQKKFAEPEHRRKMLLAIRKANHLTKNNPELKAKRREHWLRVYKTVLLRPDVVAKQKAAQRASGAKQSDTKLPWCPREYRQQYRDLCHNKRLKASEAREVILNTIKADRAKARAKLSPFERQMADLEAKVKNGTQDIGVHDARRVG